MTFFGSAANDACFNAWLTDIQKKAGKIGVMKAMERIERFAKRHLAENAQ